jgi:hypothetical protein
MSAIGTKRTLRDPQTPFQYPILNRYDAFS